MLFMEWVVGMVDQVLARHGLDAPVVLKPEEHEEKSGVQMQVNDQVEDRKAA